MHTRLSFALIIGGLALFSGRRAWLETRTLLPVSMPISLAAGHVQTPEFKSNFRAPYVIEIEVEKKLPFDTLNCMLGLKRNPDKCAGIDSVLNASWNLSAAGQILLNGSTAEDRDGGYAKDTIALILGSFAAEPERFYKVNVDVLSNSSSLSVTNPRLKVVVSSAYYVDSVVLDAPFYIVSIILVVAGVVVLWKGISRRRDKA